MNRTVLLLVACAMAYGANASAQGGPGELQCMRDMQRLEGLYRERSSVLTAQERQQAERLLALGEGQCRTGGNQGPRSREATALINKLESAPPQSQAATPRER